jgi:AsmA protein
MNKAVKWALGIAGVLVVLVLVAVVVLPMIIDVNQYKPQIEQQVAKATGRPFKLGGDLEVSVFPWIGVRLSDLHLGHPPGFKEKDFVSVKSFEVRVKLLPLLSRNVEVRRFVMVQPTIVMEKRADGKGGWEGLGPAGGAAKPAPSTDDTAAAPAPAGELPIKGLAVGEFAITDGLIVWIDQAKGMRREVQQIQLVLRDVSLDQPVRLAFSATADGKPVALEGTIGPLGTAPGKKPVPLELAATLIDELTLRMTGRIDPSKTPPAFDLALDVAEFSPRKLMDKLGIDLPIEPADTTVLKAVSLAFKLSGNAQAVQVSDGRMKLDDSSITFSTRAAEFHRPDLKAAVNLDRIDLDRYLPAPAKKEAAAKPAPKEPPAKAEKKTDYGPLRRLVLDASFKAGEIKAKNLRTQNLHVHLTARNGVIRMDPLNVDLYQGHFSGSSTVNVQKDEPATSLKLDLDGVQAGPLVRDLLDKDLIEGAMAADIGLDLVGDTPERIRRTIDGKGDLRFNDGAIVGIDLASMVRNVQTAFGLGENTTEKPRTDFAELLVPFTLDNGLFNTKGSKLVSPLLRVLAVGKADLAKETIDFRVEPKFVATIKGQGDTTQRSGVMVPVMIAGSFSDPTFTPDIKAILSQELGMGLPDEKALKEMVPSDDALKKGVRDLLKGLPLGQPSQSKTQ